MIILPPEAENLVGGVEKCFFLVSFVIMEIAEQPSLNAIKSLLETWAHEGRPLQGER